MATAQDTPPRVDQLPGYFMGMSKFDEDVLRAQSIPTDRSKDIENIAQRCYEKLVELRASGQTRQSFVFSGWFLLQTRMHDGFYMQTEYTDKQSLDDIITGIHAKTGSQVVCLKSNTWGIPFEFMPNCVTCRFL